MDEVTLIESWVQTGNYFRILWNERTQVPKIHEIISDSWLKECCGFDLKYLKSGHLLGHYYNHSGFIILTEVAD